MEQLTFLSEERPANPSASQGFAKALLTIAGTLPLNLYGLLKGSRARWVVWENVPGVLSIDGGQAFGSFLGGLAECGYGFAYRILDAQYFGVPQRRRRVFVIGYLGDWRPAAAVLFERESLCGDITPRREARQGAAGAFETGPGGGRFTDISATLDAHCKDGPMRNQVGMGVCHTLRGEGFDASEDGTGRGIPLVTFDRQSSGEYGEAPIASTLAARDYKNATDLVAYNVTFCDANGRRKDRPDGGLYVNEADTAKTLTSSGDLSTYIAFSAKDCGADAGENAPTLRAMGHHESHANGGGQIAVAIPLQEVGKTHWRFHHRYARRLRHRQRRRCHVYAASQRTAWRGGIQARKQREGARDWV
jgi:DNA (cytosine-5)-methyltransferase 1